MIKFLALCLLCINVFGCAIHEISGGPYTETVSSSGAGGAGGAGGMATSSTNASSNVSSTASSTASTSSSSSSGTGGEPATCVNGIKDGDESDLDCGGSCLTKCHTGSVCKSQDDCTTKVCHVAAGANFGVCSFDLISCNNGVQDGNETDLDCGSEECNQCDLNKKCLVDADCVKYLKCKDVSGVTTCQIP